MRGTEEAEEAALGGGTADQLRLGAVAADDLEKDGSVSRTESGRRTDTCRICEMNGGGGLRHAVAVSYTYDWEKGGGREEGGKACGCC